MLRDSLLSSSLQKRGFPEVQEADAGQGHWGSLQGGSVPVTTAGQEPRVTMADSGTRVAMADRESRVAMADSGTKTGPIIICVLFDNCIQ